MSIFREQLNPLLAPKYLAELNTQVVIDRQRELSAAMVETRRCLKLKNALK
jgi:hypothetical protein